MAGKNALHLVVGSYRMNGKDTGWYMCACGCLRPFADLGRRAKPAAQITSGDDLNRMCRGCRRFLDALRERQAALEPVG